MWLDLMWETTGDGFLHWRKHYYGLWTCILARSDGLNLKHINYGFVSAFVFSSVNWWTGVVWITCGLIVMFLSAVWTLILTAPIHCRASIGETLIQRHISPNLMKKQTHLHLVWPEYIFSEFKFLGELFLYFYQTILFHQQRESYLLIVSPLQIMTSSQL